MVPTTTNRLRWCRNIVWAAILCLSWMGVSTAREHRVPERFDRLPYRLVEVVPRERAMSRVEVIDFDRDGIDEFVQSSVGQPGKYSRLVMAHPAEDFWTPLKQISLPYPTGLAGVCDVNLDGTPEIVLSSQMDGLLSVGVYEITVSDTGVGAEIVGGLAWDVEPWLYGSYWNGGVSVWGALDRNDDGTSETLVYTLAGAMSGRPRGVGVGDWETGEMGWFAPIGSAPTEPTLLADLTGKGLTGIVVPLGAPCNGITEGATTDTLSYVTAFSLDGSQLWIREVGGPSSGPTIAVRDLDFDGVPEVVCAVRRGKVTDTRHAALHVLRPSDGEPLAEWGFDQSVNAIATVVDEGVPVIFAACADGVLRRLRLSGHALEVKGGIDCGSAVSTVSCLDLDPFEEPVLMAVTAEGDVVLSRLDLTPLAAFATGDPGVQGKYVEGAVLKGGTRCAYVATNDATYGFAVEKGPPRIWPWLVVGLVAAVGAVVSVPRTRRTVLSSLRRVVIPAADREEAVDELLAELSTAGHGKLAVTSTLRRLREQLTMLSGLDSQPAEAFDARFREAARNVQEIGLPKTRTIAARAGRVGVAPGVVATLERKTRAGRAFARRIPAELPYGQTADALSQDVDGLLEGIESNLEALKLACKMELSSVLIGEIRRAVGSRREDMLELGVELLAPAVSSLDGIRVFGTRLEISFILENLLANAIKAVSESDVRRLEIAVGADGDEAVVAMSDTGRGIAAADHARIFERGFSTREGGGHGLSRSREILERRNGSIRLVRSAPGEGSVFELRLAICRPSSGEAPASTTAGPDRGDRSIRRES